MISDTSLTPKWGYVTKRREVRNQMASYVRGNAFYKLPVGKKLVINSEHLKAGEKVIPTSFCMNSKGVTEKHPLYEHTDIFAEGQGASLSPIMKYHIDSNCLVVSIDTDAIMYGLIA